MNISRCNNSDCLILFGRILIIFLLATVNARLQKNNAELVVSCDDSAMHVRMTFKHPFGGIVFIPEHYYDSACSYGISPNRTVSEMTLSLPHHSCKMRVTNSSKKLIGCNTIAVFHHRMLETVYDYSQNVTCELRHPVKNLNTWQEPFLKTWISFEHPSSVLPEDLADKMEDSLLLVYHVKDRGVHTDMVVKNCIGHDAGTINEKTRIYQLSNPFGCSLENDLLSNFTVFRSPVGGEDMIAYAVVKNFSVVIRRRLYITCGAQICKDKCLQTCEYLQRNFHLSDIVTKSLVNRPEGSKPLITFERVERRSQNSVDDVNDVFPFEKIGDILHDSSRDNTSEEINQGSPEKFVRSKRAIERQKTEPISSGLSVIVIRAGDVVQSTVKLRFETNVGGENDENSTDLCDSILKVKMTFEPRNSSRIYGKDDGFNLTSFLRAVIAIFTLICVSAVCYSLFSFRRQSGSDYASHI